MHAKSFYMHIRARGRNRARKTTDVNVTNNNMIRRHELKNCTKLALKPLTTKNGLSMFVLCVAHFLQIILF